MRVGVSLVAEAGWSADSRVCLMKMVMMELMLFIFALLVPLLAARSLLHFRGGRGSFLHHVLAALPSSFIVCLSAAGAERVAWGGPGEWGEAVAG